LSKKLKLTLIPVAVIAVFGIIGIFSKSGDIKKIKANPKLTTATIVEHDNLGEYNTNGCWIYFEYSVNGRKYKHCQKYHGWTKEDNYFLKCTFPLVYFRDDPGLSRLLITEDEYNEFDIAQPDSLRKYNGRIL
jgi:hypothetical protein